MAPSIQRRSGRGRSRAVSSETALLVQHDYRDHAQLEPPPPNSLAMRGIPSFPVKLHEALEMIEQDGHTSAISWQPHGRAFIIGDKDAFMKIAPAYFPAITKFTSFQRQLNLYGFKRITQGLDKDCYYHKLFMKGRPLHALSMERIKVKGTGIKPKKNPDQEPNFWMMDAVQPIHQEQGTVSYRTEDGDSKEQQRVHPFSTKDNEDLPSHEVVSTSSLEGSSRNAQAESRLMKDESGTSVPREVEFISLLLETDKHIMHTEASSMKLNNSNERILSNDFGIPFYELMVDMETAESKNGKEGPPQIQALEEYTTTVSHVKTTPIGFDTALDEFIVVD